MAITCSPVSMTRNSYVPVHPTFFVPDLSNLQNEGNVARFVSTFEQNDQARCLEFWYYRFGAATGSFNVYITTNTSDNATSVPVWSRKASTWDYWRKAQIPIDDLASFRVVFESVNGDSKEVNRVANEIHTSRLSSSAQGNVAIDDIRRVSEACRQPNNCDFEDGTFCGWENIQQLDELDWEVRSGPLDADSLLSGTFS